MLVPKLQLGNAVLEALLRRPDAALVPRLATLELQLVRTYKPACFGFAKRSFRSVRSQARAWGTRLKYHYQGLFRQFLSFIDKEAI